jgi:hypothetical protein
VNFKPKGDAKEKLKNSELGSRLVCKKYIENIEMIGSEKQTF